MVAMLFFSCNPLEKKENALVKAGVPPQGIATNFTLYYTETNPLATKPREVAMGQSLEKKARLIAILRSEESMDYEHLAFPYRTFPKGLVLEVFDSQGKKSIVESDYGIIYSATNVIDLRGNVTITTADGKLLKTSQLYYDQISKWVFTAERFTYTNPEDQTVMDGEGLDFNRDFSFLNAHKTYGFVTVKDTQKND